MGPRALRLQRLYPHHHRADDPCREVTSGQVSRLGDRRPFGPARSGSGPRPIFPVEVGVAGGGNSRGRPPCGRAVVGAGLGGGGPPPSPVRPDQLASPPNWANWSGPGGCEGAAGARRGVRRRREQAALPRRPSPSPGCSRSCPPAPPRLDFGVEGWRTASGVGSAPLRPEVVRLCFWPLGDENGKRKIELEKHPDPYRAGCGGAPTGEGIAVGGPVRGSKLLVGKVPRMERKQVYTVGRKRISCFVDR